MAPASTSPATRRRHTPQRPPPPRPPARTRPSAASHLLQGDSAELPTLSARRRRFLGDFVPTSALIPQEPTGAGGPPRSQVISGMISSATMLATLIMGLIAGPAVSL